MRSAALLFLGEQILEGAEEKVYFLTSVQEPIACNGAAVIVLALGQNLERTFDSWPQYREVAGNPLMSAMSLVVQTNMHVQ